MCINKPFFILCCIFCVSLGVNAQNRSQNYLQYINTYYQLAQKQQSEFGIPASIILAQGLLESGAGEGALSKASNNHFGIKCTDWQGEKVYFDDDAKGECFRKYSQVIDSYNDHSLFLRNRPRYSFLFELPSDDYVAWAHGLKKAGYATDSLYPNKLISLIETYDLHQFDNISASNNSTQKSKTNSTSSTSTKHNGASSYGSMGTINVDSSHELMKVNGVLFVTSVKGDTYDRIAQEFDMSVEKLLKINELTSTDKLMAGTRIFIRTKRNNAPCECRTHKVQAGETMHSIAQDYGIKIVSLYKLNKKPFNQGAITGEELILRSDCFFTNLFC